MLAQGWHVSQVMSLGLEILELRVYMTKVLRAQELKGLNQAVPLCGPVASMLTGCKNDIEERPPCYKY